MMMLLEVDRGGFLKRIDALRVLITGWFQRGNMIMYMCSTISKGVIRGSTMLLVDDEDEEDKGEGEVSGHAKGTGTVKVKV